MQSPAWLQALAAPTGRHGSGCFARRARATRLVRCMSGKQAGDPQQMHSMQDKAAVLLTGFAATCLVLNSGPAQAAETLDLKPKQLETELQEILAGREATLQKLDDTPRRAQVELQKEDAEIKRVVSELESFVSAAVQGVESLRAQLVVEDAEMARLRSELDGTQVTLQQTQAALKETRASLDQAKAALEGSQKALEASKAEVEALKKDVQGAKQQAQQAQKSLQQAQRDLQQKTLAGIGDAVKLNLQGTTGAKFIAYLLTGGALTGYLAGYLIHKPKKGKSGEGDVQGRQEAEDEVRELQRKIKAEKEARQVELSAVQSEVRELQRKVAEASKALGEEREASQRARAESAALDRQSSALQAELAKVSEELNRQLKQLVKERGQSEELRSAMQVLGAEFNVMESRLAAAQADADELRAKLGKEAPAPKLAASSNGNGNGKKAVAEKVAAARATAAATAAGAAKTLPVHFALQREIQLGQIHVLVGSHPSMGSWELTKGLKMEWSEGNVWQAEASLPLGTELEFKCVQVADGDLGSSQWEEGPNHVVRIPSSGVGSVGVRVEWASGEEVTEQAEGRAGAAAPVRRDLFKMLLS